VTFCLPRMGVIGVIWIFAGIYAISGVLALTLHMDQTPTG
jgi:hypothetical protein